MSGVFRDCDGCSDPGEEGQVQTGGSDPGEEGQLQTGGNLQQLQSLRGGTEGERGLEAILRVHHELRRALPLLQQRLLPGRPRAAFF